MRYALRILGSALTNPQLRAHYVHLRASGKLHKVALVATMRKLLLILNAIIKTDTPGASHTWKKLETSKGALSTSPGGILRAFRGPVDPVGNAARGVQTT